MRHLTLILIILLTGTAISQEIKTGADQTSTYIPQLKNKKVGIVGNQTSEINLTHLVDTFLSLNIDVQKVFAPEHGFRGVADAGEKVKNGTDIKTGIPIISLYGKNKKPSSEQLSDLDVIVFDIQDVGARFYTYISTMHYVMEACAENNIPLLILDRPNPNGHIVDGPVLEKEYKSFIGMHPVPILHGMTIGEYAQMINGEKWLENEVVCDLTVIPCENYSHTTEYILPVAPSPNLPNMSAIYLYPSLCLFEGTSVSVGRGTNQPFQHFGHPHLPNKGYSFKPEPMFGSKKPKLKDEVCYGFNLKEYGFQQMKTDGKLNLNWIIWAYNNYPANKNDFFARRSFFNLLAGNSSLLKEIESGSDEIQIRKKWQVGLSKFELIRASYLIYK